MKIPVRILLVEDNEGDIELTKIAFEEGQLSADLSVTRDGLEALDYLFRRDKFSHAPAPDLILLDLNMPRMGGRELLDIIKRNEQTRAIPVVILTSSSAESDILTSYKCHANCYVIKPGTLDAFIAVAKRMEDFWIELAQLPHNNQTALRG